MGLYAGEAVFGENLADLLYMGFPIGIQQRPFVPNAMAAQRKPLSAAIFAGSCRGSLLRSCSATFLVMPILRSVRDALPFQYSLYVRCGGEILLLRL